MTTLQLTSAEAEAYLSEPRARAEWLLGAIRRIDEHEARAAAALSTRVGRKDLRTGTTGDWSSNLVLLPLSALPDKGNAPTRPSLPASAESVASELGGLLSVLAGGPVRRRLFGRASVVPEWVAAAERLLELDAWAQSSGFVERIRACDGAPVPTEVALARYLGVVRPRSLPVLAAEDVSTLGEGLAHASDLVAARKALVGKVRERFTAAQESAVTKRLDDIDVDALHQTNADVRVGPLRKAGIVSVADVLARRKTLADVRGVSEANARSAVAAARALETELRSEPGLRFSMARSDRAATSLLDASRALLHLDEVMVEHGPEVRQLVQQVGGLAPALSKAVSLVVLHEASPRRGRDVTVHLRERAEWLRTSGVAEALRRGQQSEPVDGDVWDDFAVRSATYLGLIAEITGVEVDEVAARGSLPAEIADGVARTQLDVAALRPNLQSSLRGYQRFGAAYTVVQQRVLIGDEMGLGKTIQALTVMAHLSAKGSSRFLVVCPPAVLVNWLKETRKHTTLSAHRLHGTGKEDDLRKWKRDGGVAVTTFGTLANLGLDVDPDLLVVDEAHLVKNPAAQRTIAVAALATRSHRVMFMTGTPLENKVEEFTNLISMLQPEIVDGLRPEQMVVGARGFRELVAPVYLRRNAQDVLTELPEMTEVEEWTELGSAERRAYLRALADGKFHDLRRVAWTVDPASSEKLERLSEIVEEARSNRRKVIVFSTYRDVVALVEQRLGDAVAGVITGATPAVERQRIVDRFSDSTTSWVLIGQIEAIGTGLNIQAASEVVLCEPQVKPSTEMQAIARTHRMGQTNRVQVHRLLSVDSVDERMLALLAGKAELFDQFVARSEVADVAPEATDITEKQLIRQVLEMEAQKFSEQLRGLATRPAEAISDPTTDQPGEGPRAASSNDITSRTVPAKPTGGPSSSGKAPQEQKRATGSSQTGTPARQMQTQPDVDEASHKRISRQPVHPAVEVCGSCDGPISVLGHCRCS